jgi:hypothetical protein
MFYEQHAPAKVGDIPTILKKYAGHEPTMFGRVAGKYGVDLWLWEEEQGLYPHAVEVNGAGADSDAQRRALLGGASGGSAAADDLRTNPSRAGKKTMAALGEARNALVDRGERLNEMSALRALLHIGHPPSLPPSLSLARPSLPRTRRHLPRSHVACFLSRVPSCSLSALVSSQAIPPRRSRRMLLNSGSCAPNSTSRNS